MSKLDTPQSFLDNHRGPFVLMVTRPFATKTGFFRSEWLSGETCKDEVESEALAILADKRDTVTSVSVWSVREECFVGAYQK